MAVMDNLKESPEHVAGWYGRATRFIADVRSELSRVSWPTWREVRATTLVVILTSMLFGIYLFLVDLGLSYLMVWIDKPRGV